MNPDDLERAIAQAFDQDRVEVTRHFWDELRADGFVLVDVRCALTEISAVCDMGVDQAGNPKFEVTGHSTDGRVLSVVCSFKETGAVLLLTVYEGTQHGI